jgi:hypothetical protein
MWCLTAKRTFSPETEVGLAVFRARASTNVLRFSLRATGYREQYLQISQVLSHQTGWGWRRQRSFFEASDFDFRSNLKRQHPLFSVLYRCPVRSCAPSSYHLTVRYSTIQYDTGVRWEIPEKHLPQHRNLSSLYCTYSTVDDHSTDFLLFFRPSK